MGTICTGSKLNDQCFNPKEVMNLEMPSSIFAFIEQIKQQLNKQIYDVLLDKKIFLDILTQFDKYYINHQNASDLIQIVLDYMALSKEYYNDTLDSEKLKKENFAAALAQKYHIVHNQIFFFNKDILKIFAYISRDPESRPSHIDHCYLDLKFDLSLDQARKVAKVVKEMCNYDLRSFAFLSNYLMKSCIILEQKGEKIIDIEDKLLKILQTLGKENPPAPSLDAPQQLLQKHENYKYNHQNVIFDLNKIEMADRMPALQKFILERASESIQSLPKFNHIVKNLCVKQGYHFRSCVKLKNINQKKALQRVKEKLLQNFFQKYSLKKQILKKGNVTINQYTQTEILLYEDKISKLFENVSFPIEFKVSDMLRGKCMFSDVQKINQCCAQLKEQISRNGLVLLEVDNRLKGTTGTSDLVLKILVDQTIAELQLVIDLNVSAYEFSHKIYELIRSKFFTPLTMLHLFNKEIINEFFNEVIKVINFNTKTEDNKDQYRQKINYFGLKSYFQELVKSLPFQLDEKISNSNEIDISMMKYLVKKLDQIKTSELKETGSQKISEIYKRYNNGLYKFALKQHNSAKSQLNEYCSLFQSQNKEIFYKIGLYQPLSQEQQNLLMDYALVIQQIGLINKQASNADEALKMFNKYHWFYQKISNNQVKIIKNLQYIGEVYNKEGNYFKALESYEMILKEKQVLFGENSLEYANTLNNIGLFNKNYGKYPQALALYQKSLAIKQTVTGKDSIQCSVTIQNIGNVYKNTQQYPLGLKFYQRCLDIQEKIKGKSSIDCASTLDNIGVIMRATFRLTQALYYHNRAAQIIEKVLGKETIDYSSVLNNIGFVHRLLLNFDESLRCHKLALQIKENIKGKENVDLTNTIMNIGTALRLQGKLEEALKYQQRASSILWKILGNDSHAAAQAQNEVGQIYAQMGNYQQAMKSFKRCQQVYIKIKTKVSPDWSTTAINIGGILTEQGKFEEAFEYLTQSSQNFLKIKGRTVSYAISLYALGQYYIKKQEIENSIKVLEEAYEIFNKYEYKEYRLGKICTVLGDNYAKNGDYKKAIEYYDKAPKLKVHEWSYIDNLVKKAECHKKFGHNDKYELTLKQIQSAQ